MRDSIQAAQAGSYLNVSLELTNEQVIQFVQRNPFVSNLGGYCGFHVICQDSDRPEAS